MRYRCSYRGDPLTVDENLARHQNPTGFHFEQPGSVQHNGVSGKRFGERRHPRS
jgi:hypothetical protein